MSDDGVTNRLTVVEPATNSNTIVLCVPAMGVPANKYDTLCCALTDAGLSAATMDLRGLGASSVRASKDTDFSYAEIVAYDLPCAISALHEHFSQRRIVLLGHSLGGQLSALYLSQNQDLVAGLILTASCSVYYRGWRMPKSLGVLLFSQVAVIASKCCGYFPGHRFKFAGREARGVMRDWAHNALTGRYASTNINYETDLAQVSLPVLAINFDDDKFAPVRATRNLLGKLSTLCDVQMLRLSGADLNQGSADHFNWMKHPTAVSRAVEKWLPQHLSSGKGN